MAPKSVARRVDLHTEVHNPPRAKKLSAFMEAIEAREKLRGLYYEMGGQEVQSDKQCVILLKMLPPDTPATMVMLLEECKDFEAFNTKLENQIDWFFGHPGFGQSPCPARGRPGVGSRSRAAAAT